MANALLDILSSLFATLAKAYGKIRNYQIVVSLTLFLNFPLSYVALKVGYPPFMIFVVYSIVSMLLVIIRCRLIAGMFEINVLSAYSKQVLIPVLRVLFISSLLPLAVNSGMEEGWLRLFAMTACSIVSVAFAVYVLGLTSGERAFVENRIINIKERLVKMDDKKQRRVGSSRGSLTLILELTFRRMHCKQLFVHWGMHAPLFRTKDGSCVA